MVQNDKKYPLMQLLGKGKGNAIESNGGSLSYENLRSTVLRVGEQLASFGIGPSNTVGIVTPNGPIAASIFISVASFATAAPLNPAYTKEEFKYYLRDLDAKLLIIMENTPTDAIKAAQELTIKIIEIRSGELPGDITLAHKGKILNRAAATYNQANDVSLVLHTSGTTSRPKIVPLTSDNISVSARNIARTLKLNDRDRYLNIMPLFHIHGLLAGVLTTLESGGSIYCSTGFDALKFFNMLNDAKPTWFSAVPTMHQAILDRAKRNKEIIKQIKLKFIRSSSASLPVSVLKKLELEFNCPVIEAYGMTEASHQMTSNPLPPLRRKPGTVGLPAGPIIGILSNEGQLVGANQIGEIAIKGANVMTGYRSNAQANRENFSNGWFKTGDQGSIDDDGFLTIKGRLKEIINRGGEKVSPHEVDEIIMNHPNVAQVITFSIPHAKLGEDVGAALVLIDPDKTTKSDIKEYLRGKIAAFKIPRTVIFMKEIPKGSTGKIQRIGLAKKLGIIE